MKFVVMALAGMALASCAYGLAAGVHTDAPRPSDTCVVLSVAKDAATDTALGQAMQARMRAIVTTELDRPVYRCGDVSYQTDPATRGRSFLSIGFSADRHFAALNLQQVAGPLAGAGFSCLYEAADESWTLRGCQMEWIS